MKTLSQTKTNLIPIDELETTSQIINAVEMDEALKFTTVNQSLEKALSVQYVEFGEVGKERKSDWMRFVNSLNKYDETPIKRMITGDKKSLDWGEVIVSRTDIQYNEDGFLFEFKKPIQIVVEQIGEKYITVEAKKIKGLITWEWYHRRNGHEELENIAGICEIYIYNTEIIE